MSQFQKQLTFGLAAAVLPPLGVTALYLYGSSTGCSGGDCTGPMMAVMLLGLAAIPVSLGGVVWTVIVIGGELFRRLRNR